jgi:hypothetical protein
MLTASRNGLNKNGKIKEYEGKKKVKERKKGIESKRK